MGWLTCVSSRSYHPSYVCLIPRAFRLWEKFRRWLDLVPLLSWKFRRVNDPAKFLVSALVRVHPNNLARSQVTPVLPDFVAAHVPTSRINTELHSTVVNDALHAVNDDHLNFGASRFNELRPTIVPPLRPLLLAALRRVSGHVRNSGVETKEVRVY
jgi:hypothetical protein